MNEHEQARERDEQDETDEPGARGGASADRLPAAPAEDDDTPLGDTDTRARRLATLAQVRATYPLLPVDAETASCFARIAAAELEAGRRIRRHDAWIAATALRHGVAVVTQDANFSAFDAVTVVRV